MKKDIYTSEQWAADGSFKAEPGQEIEETVYNELFNVLPPLPLPIETAQRALTDLNIPVHAGFLMGEPHRSVLAEMSIQMLPRTAKAMKRRSAFR